jgi:cytochrome P450
VDVLRTVLGLRHDPLAELGRLTRTYGDIVYLPLLHRSFYLAIHPRHVDQILRTRADRYDKGTRTYAKIRGLLGDGLVTSDGAQWRRHRALVQPALHRDRIARFRPLVVRLTRQTLRGWRGAADRGGTIDIDREMRRLTLRIVARALFRRDVGAQEDPLGSAIETALRFTAQRAEGVVDPGRLPTPGRRRFRRALVRLDEVVDHVIASRRPDADDLLSMLVAARDARDPHLTDRELRDQVLTLLLAGHETTASALTWTFHLLSRAPARRREVREEAVDLEAVELGRLRQTRAIADEAMRLFPPIWMVERRAREPDTIDDYTVPAGSVVALSQYLTHRHPGIWAEPNRFDPDRFQGRDATPRPNGAFFPFGAGPRTCAGAGFAMMELLLIIPTVLAEYDLEPCDPLDAAPVPGITLRPPSPFPLRVRTLRAD